MTKVIRDILSFVLLGAYITQSGATEFNVMSWGIRPNTPKPTFINEIRLGCPPSPEYCINKLAAYRGNNIRKVSLAIHWKTIPINSIENHVSTHLDLMEMERSFLVEISIDDFGSFVKKFGSTVTKRIITSLIARKDNARRLHTVGVTLYEDELASILSNDEMAIALKEVDRIALFMHHRSPKETVESYIRSIRHITPNIDIYLGVYHYDRSDYISCTEGSTSKCSDTQEVSFFEETLKTQLQLLLSKKANGLELYPGYFGDESNWAGWSNARICRPIRVPKCIESSKAMSTIVMQKLSNLSARK